MLSSTHLKKRVDSLITDPASDVIHLVDFPEHLLTFVADLIGESIKKSINVDIFSDWEVAQEWITVSKKEDRTVVVEIGDLLDVRKLTSLGYNRVNKIYFEGDFSQYGDVINLWPIGWSNPLRISLWGDKVESITMLEPQSRRSIRDLDQIRVGLMIAQENSEGPSSVYVGNSEAKQFSEQKFIYVKQLSKVGYEPLFGVDLMDLQIRSLPTVTFTENTVNYLHNIFKLYEKLGYKFLYAGSSPHKLFELNADIKRNLEPSDELSNYRFKRGFVWESQRWVVLTDYELFGYVNLDELYGAAKVDRKKKPEDLLFRTLLPGDYVVHEDHGVGRYSGIIERDEGTFLQIDYAGKDKLFLPLTASDKITKYIGSGKGEPVLTTLSGGAWRRIREKVGKDAAILAKKLVQLYAMRQLTKIDPIVTEKTRKKISDFIDSFQFEDTEDQRNATSEILTDLERGYPMDRLLVGDVGFGKTEVALRAIYAAATAGFQVAFLAPTTILARQHAALLEKRLEKSGLKVATLSRFIPPAERSQVLKALEKGEVDVVVGTHTLLSSSTKFRKLGLIVIDEEQRFGVEQKEKLRAERVNVHVLSMSATPIPRTLNMALNGVRDISLITTPPPGRKVIKNLFNKFDWGKVERAVNRELERGGQVYFLHNRVADIERKRKELLERFPKRVVEVAHGKLSAQILSDVMGRFAAGEIDILLCTTIIENGIDLPNVNTLIVDRSEIYGLSQLYQIRGRVGRSDRQAYAYFMFGNLVGDSDRRLDALMESESLGAGFTISTRDLEIRGAGQLLGREQSGSIGAVGFALFSKLLSERIDMMKEAINTA